MRAVLAAVLAALLLPVAAHAERYGTSADGQDGGEHGAHRAPRLAGTAEAAR